MADPVDTLVACAAVANECILRAASQENDSRKKPSRKRGDRAKAQISPRLATFALSGLLRAAAISRSNGENNPSNFILTDERTPLPILCLAGKRGDGYLSLVITSKFAHKRQKSRAARHVRWRIIFCRYLSLVEFFQS